MSRKEEASSPRAGRPGFVHQKKWKYLFDGFAIIVMGALLYYGSSRQIHNAQSDAGRYQCYAQAFWHGIPTHVSAQCEFLTHPGAYLIFFTQEQIVSFLQCIHTWPVIVRVVQSQTVSQPFHALPYEYPLLTLIPFSAGLLAPPVFFQQAFACAMILVAALVYLILCRLHSRQAGIAFCLYSVTGGWATIAARYDIVSSVLVFLAIVLALHQRWYWSFSLLALGTLTKFYPIVLLPSFVLVYEKQFTASWFTWRRWSAPLVFVFVCLIVMIFSFLLNAEGTLAPFSYFTHRPVQVESFESSILWIFSFVDKSHISFVYTYGSLNTINMYEAFLSYLFTFSLVIGFLYLYWLQWRQTIDLSVACLLILLLVMVMGKIFSPQYLIWIIPLLAYIGGCRLRWIVPWIGVCALTHWIYPYLYTSGDGIMTLPALPAFLPAIFARNVLLFACMVSLFLYYSRACSSQVDSIKQDHIAEEVNKANDL